jgi:AAA domain
MSNDTTNARPTTHQADLAKLPRALAPLLERPQWAIWRWTQKPGGGWQKPPFMATQPVRHASTTDPSTWADYATALAAVQAGHGDGVTYVLTKQDGLAAVDLDYCRTAVTGSVEPWAQLMLEQALKTYCEITVSGSGLRIWGVATGDSLHRKFELDTNDNAAVELFRATNKALTISGLDLLQGRSLGNIDRLMDWCVFFGEKHKPAPAAAAAPIRSNGNGHGLPYSLDEIELIVSTGALPPGANRSDLFHAIVGHYVGCGWDSEQITTHIGQFPDGIGGRYLSEGRLSGEVARSVGKYDAALLPASGVDGWVNGWEAKAPQLDPELDDDIPEQKLPDPELDDDVPEQTPPGDPAPDLDDDELDDDFDSDDLVDEEPQRRSDLPPMYRYGDPDSRPIKSWAIKRLMPAVGHGVLAGQWGTYKTFTVFDLAACMMTGQPFLGYPVKRQCGVLLLAAEGADEVRLRMQAVVNAKCGNMLRAPFCWYETAPTLLHKDSVNMLVAMGEQAAASIQAEFGLPLGLVVIDTMAVAAGYREQGAENDSAVVAAVMRVLKDVAERLSCFVLGIDHYGKNLDAGVKGSVNKETPCDLVLACLGERERNGSVTHPRLAVRKCRGGVQGREFPFTTRVVEHPEKDEDGEAITTLVIDWQPVPPGGAQQQADPWAQGRKQEQRTAALRLKRVLMGILADEGVELPIPPDGPVVRMVAQRIVQNEFYMHTPVDGTPEQKRKIRHQQFSRALAWAEDKQLIGVEEIDDVTYLRLTRPDPEDDDEEPEPE